MLFFVLITTATILVFVHILLNHSERARLIKKIPGPDGLFVIGNALEYIGTPVEIFDHFRRCSIKWKRLYRFWAFNIAAISIYTPEDVEILISSIKNNSKSKVYTFLQPWLQDGLLISSGAKWQQRRKILTPAFHFNILRRFCITIEENSRKMVESLSNSAGKKVDLVQLMTEFTLNSICETAMGTRLSDEAAEETISYKDAIHNIGKYLFERVTRLILHTDFIFYRTTVGRKLRTSIQTVQEFTKRVIKGRKEYIEKHGPENLDDDDITVIGKRKRTAMLDLLIQAQKDNLIDDQGIQEEVDTFMFEGHDTTASGLVYCFMLLAHHKDVQEKIFAELNSIFGDSDRDASYEDLSKLRYLECCIKESMRLYPPVPFISRLVEEPVTLGEYYIPKDVDCHIHIFDLHRRPELFPDPLRFDPDRFLPENCVGRHPYAYIPFSAGPRNCIGQKFAIMEMKSALSAVLRRFKLNPVTHPSELQFKADLVLRTTHPVFVTFEKRT